MLDPVEKGGRLLDGSAFAFKTDALWLPLTESDIEVRYSSDKKGEKVVIFTSNSLPYLTFYGTIPDSYGIFFVTKMHFLAGNYGGWNEYDIDISGRGRLRVFNNQNAAFTLLDTIEKGTIISGKIRRESTRLTGEQALIALQNRAERIQALVDWMHESALESGAVHFANQTEFENYWKPRLFPKNKLERRTAPQMPSKLESARQEGHILSDWEEASSWIYIYYDWKKMTSVLHNEVMLIKIK